jgi:cyanophycin synthetase
VALAWGGAAPHNLENALAAVAAGLSLGVPPAVAADGLRNWTANEGRLEVHRVAGRTVVLDYGHNPAAVAATLRCARSLGGRALVAVLGVPGDRRDDLVVMTGQVAGSLCDRVIVKEDLDRRGRPAGEVARLLMDGVLAGGLSDACAEIVPDEAEAVERAVRRGRPGDVVVAFYERRDRVLAALRSCEAAAGGQAADAGAGAAAGPENEGSGGPPAEPATGGTGGGGAEVLVRA